MAKRFLLLLAVLSLGLGACASTGSDSDGEYDWDDDGSYGERYDPERYFEPEYGCRCDRREAVCYDRFGAPSQAQTGRYFGGAAADRLRSGGGLFEPRAGVTCDRRRAVCFDEAGPSVRRTREAFGERAAQRVEAWKHSRGGASGKPQPNYLFRPDAETTCDQRTRICYGSNKPSVVKTRKYFGEAAAARVAEERAGGLRDDDGQIFTPKAGVKCDRAVRICYSNNGASVAQTEKHFGADAAAKLRRDQLCAQGKGACDGHLHTPNPSRHDAQREAEQAAKRARSLEENAARKQLELERRNTAKQRALEESSARKQRALEEKAARKELELKRKLEKQRAKEERRGQQADEED